MQRKNCWFATPLPKSVRFTTALQITAIKFTASKLSIHKILMIVMNDEGIVTEQYKIVAGAPYTKDRVEQIKNFFVETYKNEDEIIAFLNREISKRYFQRNRQKGETPVDTSLKNIVNECIGDLINDL